VRFAYPGYELRSDPASRHPLQHPPRTDQARPARADVGEAV